MVVEDEDTGLIKTKCSCKQIIRDKAKEVRQDQAKEDFKFQGKNLRINSVGNSFSREVIINR